MQSEMQSCNMKMFKMQKDLTIPIGDQLILASIKKPTPHSIVLPRLVPEPTFSGTSLVSVTRLGIFFGRVSYY